MRDWLLPLLFLAAACRADPDRDGDGVPNGQDCGPDDPATWPGAPESCDGLDHDCDGEVWEPGAVGVEGKGFAGLQDALDLAEADVPIWVCGGTHTGPFWAERPAEVRAQEPFVLEGGGAGPVLRVSGGSLLLDGATVQGGLGHSFGEGTETWGGGILVEGGVLELSDCVVTLNEASYGGGLAVLEGGRAALTGCVLTANHGGLGGGLALLGEGPALELVNTQITANTADYGGGIYMQSEGADLRLAGEGEAEVADNVAAVTGGGLYLSAAGGGVLVEGLTLRGNSATGSGGAQLVADGTTTLRALTVEDNAAAVAGGGLYLRASGGGFVLEQVHVAGNQAAYGGGVFVELGADLVLEASDTTLHGNTASESGGGLEVFPAPSWSATVSGLAVEGNAAPFGGGVYVGRTAGAALSGLVVEGNTAEVAGAGLYLELNQAGVALSGVEVLDNAAPYGAGLYVYLLDTAGTVSGQEVQISGNSADYGGGIWLNQYGGSAALTGLVVQDNTATGAGGGLYAWFEGEGLSADFSGTELVQNRTDGWGGGAYLSGWTVGGGALIPHEVTVTGLVLRENTAATGGGVHLDAGRFTLADALVEDNSAATGGGLSADVAGVLTVEEVRIAGNSASLHGGGAAVQSLDPDAALRGAAELEGNSAALSGGGLSLSGSSTYAADPALSVSGLLVQGNSAEQGGGVAVGVDTALGQSQLLANTASARGGGVWLGTGVLALEGVDLGVGAQDNLPDDLCAGTALCVEDLGAEVTARCEAGVGCEE